MNEVDPVKAYIAKHANWKKELAILREIFKQTELEEEIKWGAPHYCLNNKLVAGIAGFKNHYALWFHQGVFLKDEKRVLLNAQEGVTKALRQWRFFKGDEIPQALVLDYVNEAIANVKAGKELKPKKKAAIEPPLIFKACLKQNTRLKNAFENLSPGKQREYITYISEAKKESTQQSRLDKIIPLILQGKGLHDKYKNC